jgi:hypothetical protein
LSTLQTSCDVSASCGASLPQARPSPTAVVQTTVTGAATPGDERVVLSARPRLRACANQALAQDPSQQGTLVVSISVAANGDVTTATVTRNGGLNAQSAACMSGVMRRLSFDAGGARMLTVTIAQTKQSS